MQIFLETECLRQQQFTLDNVDNLLELDSDVEVRRYLDMPTPPTRKIVIALSRVIEITPVTAIRRKYSVL